VVLDIRIVKIVIRTEILGLSMKETKMKISFFSFFFLRQLELTCDFSVIRWSVLSSRSRKASQGRRFEVPAVLARKNVTSQFERTSV